MTDALLTLLPMFAFILIPLWIPLAAVAVGALMDGIATMRGTAPAA